VGEQPGAGGQLGPAGRGHGGAGGPVLGQHGGGLGQGAAAQLGRVGRPGGGGRHPADRPAQVDRGRAGHLKGRRHPLEVPAGGGQALGARPRRAGLGQAEHHPEGAGDPDGGGAPHGEAPEGVHHLGGAAQPAHHQPPREQRLVDDLQPAVVPGHGAA
jgi:hypothetical protein